MCLWGRASGERFSLALKEGMSGARQTQPELKKPALLSAAMEVQAAPIAPLHNTSGLQLVCPAPFWALWGD